DCNGTVTVSVSGGTPPLSYDLGSGPQANGNFTNLCPNTYQVTITDANGCTITSSMLTIGEPPAISIDSEASTDVLCNGDCTGTVTVAASGGTPVLSYNIGSGPQGNGNFTNLCPNTYQVTITDANGCTIVSSNLTVGEPPALSVDSEGSTDVLCFGDCNGTVTVSVSGGTAPLSYDLGGGPQGNGNFTNLCPGIYQVTVTDANGCTIASSNLTVGEPPALSLNSEGSTDVLCFGDCNGTVTVVVSGGTPPLSYDLGTGPQANGNFTNLCPNTYQVTITDANGCTIASSNLTVGEPPALSLDSEGSTDVLCFGDCNGTVTVSVSGGTPPLSYNLGSGPQANGNFTNLCPNTYQVTITDANGCTITSSMLTVGEPPGMSLDSEVSTDVLCFGDCNGTVTVVVSGGTPPLSFDLGSGPQANGDFTNLCPNTYQVTVTDANGCTITSSLLTVGEPPVLSLISENVTDVLCFGDCNGTITVVVAGGTPPLSYDNGSGLQVNGNYTNLCPNTYQVTVTDANGCTIVSSLLIVGEPAELAIVIDSFLHVSCYGGNDGEINVSTSGGTPTYTYTWTTVGGSGLVAGAEDQSGLSTGWYYVTVTDQNLCEDTLSIQLIDPYPILISETHTDVLCNGGSTGTIDITVSDGNPPYTFDWDNDGPDNPDDDPEDLPGVPAGSYCVTITDAQNCTESLCNIVINEPPVLTLTLDTLTPPLCFEDSNGTATVTAGGGTPGYTITWCNGETGLIADSLYDGLCVVTVTDANGCTETVNVNVVEPPELTIDNEAYTDVMPCNGDNNGTVTITASGGTAPLSYDIGVGPPQSGNGTFTGLAPGTYTVTVTDANNCAATGTPQTVSEPPAMTMVMDSTMVFCSGDCSGTATATVNGGQLPYTYLWSNGDNADIADSLCAGYATVTVTDLLGCYLIDSVQIIDTSNLVLNIVNQMNATCFGDCDGTAEALASGGFPPYTYTWSNGDSGVLADTLCAGLYTVTVEDSQLCSRIESVNIIEPDSIQIAFTNYLDIACNGDCNGGFTASVTGGTLPFTYDLPGISNGTDSVFAGLCAGNYTITVTDASGCTNTDDTSFVDPPLLTGSMNLDAPNLCFGDCVAEATLNEAGGTGPYSYAWLDGQITQTAIGLCPGWAYGTVTDDHGCTFNDSILIVQPDSIELSFVNTDIPCGGVCTGQSVVTAIGGTPVIDFIWDANAGSQTGNTATNLCGGIFFVTATDGNGCTNSDWTQIIDTSDLQLSVFDSTM
ncbi:MAG: SprB repeat-containing protein, partial [Bacteroidota bacterium]